MDEIVNQTGARRPRIGISGSDSGSKSVAAIMTQIRSAGGEPVFLGDHSARVQKSGTAQAAVAADLANVDALIVMGNNGDIDPAKYGASTDAHTKVETDTARAAYEEAAIQSALASRMPLLGICGGMQRINVLGGGTLHQHVPDLVGDNHHMQGDSNIAPFMPVQAVTLAKGTKLAEIGGATSSVYVPGHTPPAESVVLENSFHHQAVDKVRGDFRVNATSDDGIIEGIEPRPGSQYANQYVMGVQWHPEFGASELGPKIAGSVTEAARAFAQTKSTAAEPLDVKQAGIWQASASNVPPSPQMTFLDPEAIKSDAATYQFRSGGNKDGVTKHHGIGNRWDPILGSNPVIVHQRLNGEYYIADGHHRLDLAKRTNTQGTGPGKLSAVVLREADGYTPEDVKLIAAYKNLESELSHGGSSTKEIIDGARVMKEARERMDHPKWLPSLQMNKGDLHVSYTLSQLSDQSLARVAQGNVPVDLAEKIARAVPDAAQQDKAINFIGDKTAQNYNVSMRFEAAPVQGNGYTPQSLSQPEPEPEPLPEAPAIRIQISSGHVARLMQQRAAQAQAVAR